jgi:hypothetical protein
MLMFLLGLCAIAVGFALVPGFTGGFALGLLALVVAFVIAAALAADGK